MAILEYEKADSLGKPVKISLNSLGVTEEDVIAILNGAATTGADPAAGMAARVAKEAGLTGEEQGLRRTDLRCADVNACDLA